jgi:hypothetical protein
MRHCPMFRPSQRIQGMLLGCIFLVACAAQARSPLPGGNIRGMQAGILHTF